MSAPALTPTILAGHVRPQPLTVLDGAHAVAPACALTVRQVARRYVTWAFAMDATETSAPVMLCGRLDAVALGADGTRGTAAVNVAILELLPTLADIVTRHGHEHVSLLITNSKQRRAIRAVTDTLGPLHVIAQPSRHHQVAIRVAHHQAESAALALVEARTPLRPRGPVHIATDGSVRTGHRGAGAAWVRPDGAFWAGPVDTRSIAHAELTAIAHAIRTHSASRLPLVISSDSRTAIAMARAALNGQINATSRADRSLQRTISRLSGLPHITLTWVKGHSGHPMNELADRLAVAARRYTDAGLDGCSAMRRLTHIVDQTCHALAA